MLIRIGIAPEAQVERAHATLAPLCRQRSRSVAGRNVARKEVVASFLVKRRCVANHRLTGCDKHFGA